MARGPKPQKNPSPREIKRKCQAIRNGTSRLGVPTWNERTYRLRAGWTPKAVDEREQWTAPLISLRDMNLTENDIPYQED